jgi:HK97 family phage major capsid protein
MGCLRWRGKPCARAEASAAAAVLSSHPHKEKHMSKLNELEQKRSQLLKDATAALRSDKPSEERYTAYDAKVAEMAGVDAEIARHRSAEKLEGEERTREEAAEAARRAGRPPMPPPGHIGKAGEEERELSKEETEQRNKQEKRAYNHYLRTRDESQLRAMSSGTGSQGGYTIPVLTQPLITQAELAFGGVIPFLDPMPTTSGETINWPLGNDTTNMGSEIAENVAASEQDAVLGTVPLTTTLFTTSLIQIPRTLLRDSVVDMADYIVKLMAIRRARRLAYSVINGTSATSAFASLLNGATVGATSASPTALTLPDLSEIFGNVDPGYALNGRFTMHRNTRIYLACLRNSLGAPIFPLDQDGMLTKIFGKDIVDDQGMPAVAANAPAAGQKLILFGDLKSYIYRPVGTMEVMRLEERYAELNQVAFVGFYSAGGQFLDAGTHPIQLLQQHA